MSKTDDRSDQEHIGKVQDYFDENAEFWSELYERPESDNDAILANRTRLAVRMIADGLPENANIFDAGCGAGVASLELANRGYSVHGLDIAADLLGHARARFEKSSVPNDRWQFTHSDLLGAELADNSFDAIIALGFIQYQPSEATAMNTFHRILKPGGKLVITGPTKYRLSRFLDYGHHLKTLRRWLTFSSKKARSAEHERVLEISPHHYTPGRFKVLLDETGFETLEYVGHGFGDYNRHLVKLNRVLPLGRWANDLVFSARKK